MMTIAMILPLFAIAQKQKNNALFGTVGGNNGNFGIAYERKILVNKDIKAFGSIGTRSEKFSEYQDFTQSSFSSLTLFSLAAIIIDPKLGTRLVLEDAANASSDIRSITTNNNVRSLMLGAGFGFNIFEIGATLRTDFVDQNTIIAYKGELNPQTGFNEGFSTVHNNKFRKSYVLPSFGIRYDVKNTVLLRTGISMNAENTSAIKKSILPYASVGFVF